MVQLADLFSVPEMCLLCNVTEYFEKNNIDYHPQILFRDIKVSEDLYQIANTLFFINIVSNFPEFNRIKSSSYA